MAFLDPHRDTITRAAFVILVILVPLTFGIGWNEHRRNDEVRHLLALRTDDLVASCERGNVVRDRLNKHIVDTREQTDLLIDYMRLDAATKKPPLDTPERAAILRLLALYDAAGKVPQIALPDCEEIRRNE